MRPAGFGRVRGKRVWVIGIVLGLLLAGAPSTTTASHHPACPDPADPSGLPVWPPLPTDGEFDMPHFGEGHWDEGQGAATMPVVVQDMLAYSPEFVTFSSDMAKTGDGHLLECFRDIMDPVLDEGIPWFNSPGNHDRQHIAVHGGVDNWGIHVWRYVFRDMALPWGTGFHPGEGFVVPEEFDAPAEGERFEDDMAATHYYFDYGPEPGNPMMRIIVLDNSLHSFTQSDVDQYPAVGPGERDLSQFAFLQRTAEDAREQGLLTFAMFHQPTQDPRDPTNVDPISFNHTMSKGASADNQLFDVMAVAHDLTGVLMAHIQGNVVYEVGDVAFYVNGGAGGQPYALHTVGTDTGYFYAWRLFRFFEEDGEWDYRSYLLPLVDHIELEGPQTTGTGEVASFEATAVQPFDPDLTPRSGRTVVPHEPIRLELRQPDPGQIDYEHIPRLAYVWQTSDADVLKPVPGEHDPVDDPAFDPDTMTTSGEFEAVGEGEATITIVTGSSSKSTTVTVGS